MDSHIVHFDELPWQAPMHGLRVKAYQQDGKRLRLVEFSAEFVEPDWCVNGHVGFLLEGILQVEFHGHTTTYKTGDGLIIPAGPAHGHKARSLTPVTRVVLVEDV